MSTGLSDTQLASTQLASTQLATVRLAKLGVSFAAGLVFAAGLGVGRMTDPRRVHAFLDVTGAWDPALMFVMAGALSVFAPLSAWARRKKRPWLDARFHLPSEARVSPRLVLGSILFGVGWGVSGVCPGPGFAALGSLFVAGPDVTWLAFLVAMLGGMAIGRRRLAAPSTQGR